MNLLPYHSNAVQPQPFIIASLWAYADENFSPTTKIRMSVFIEDAATAPASTGERGLVLCGRWADWKDTSKPKRKRTKKLKIDQNPEPYGPRIKETKEQVAERHRLHDNRMMRHHSWWDRWDSNLPQLELIPNTFPGLFGFASVASSSRDGQGKQTAEKTAMKKPIKLANKPTVSKDAKTKAESDANKLALKQRLNCTYAEWSADPDQNNNSLIEVVYEYVAVQLRYMSTKEKYRGSGYLVSDELAAEFILAIPDKIRDKTIRDFSAYIATAWNNFARDFYRRRKFEDQMFESDNFVDDKGKVRAHSDSSNCSVGAGYQTEVDPDRLAYEADRLKRALATIPEEDRALYQAWKAGRKQSELAKEAGVSQPAMSGRLKKIEKRMDRVL
jgi:RNA polymerase sigma factor (sigma-70 family)